MQTVSECSEKARLRRLCRAYLLTYWETMHRLDHVSTYREFEETHERAEGVRLLFDRARTEFHSHMEQHGCEMLCSSNETQAHRNRIGVPAEVLGSSR